MNENKIQVVRRKKPSSISNQKRAIIILLAVCFVLAAALIVVNILTGMRKFEVPGENAVYYIIRTENEKGETVYVLADKDRNTLESTSDGYFITAGGTLVAIDQTTGLGSVYARPATDGNEQLGVNDRIIIFPVTNRDGAQSIEVVNKNGTYTFYRKRVIVDTDMTTYTCLLVGDDYLLLAQKDPSDPESEYIEYKRGDDGYYTLLSGNKLDVNSRTGAIRTVSYTDFDGKVYEVKKTDGVYRLYDENGKEVTDRITKTGEKLDSESKPYVDTLYDYLVTANGTLLKLDAATGALSAWGVREYNSSTERFSVYHFLKRGDKYVMCDVDGNLITDTSIDDKDYYSTANHAYLAFNEDNGSYKVRIRNNYYLIADNNGTYYLYNKGALVNPDASGYYPTGSDYVSFDTASGSFTRLSYNGKEYVEAETKLLNATDETDVTGEFVIKGYEDTEYDESLFAALVTNGGYAITSGNGKLNNPERLEDGSINYAVYGLVECDRVNEAGETYHHVPSYYIFTDLEGNSHKIIFGDQIISGAGYYVRYEGMSADSDTYDTKHEAVYILLDNYSMGYTETYEMFYYYSISDVFLAPVENIIKPKILPYTSINTYFDVTDFVISTLNHDKLHDAILSDTKEDDDAYRDIWVNFSYQDIEERRNSAYSTIPYIMGACELYGYTINSDSVDRVLKAMMDMTCIGVRKLGVDYSSLIKYGLDEPEYVIRYNITSNGLTPVLFISKLTPNNTYYVYSEMYDMIVEVDRSSLPFLTWSDDLWLTKDMYTAGISFCDKIKLESGEWWAAFDIEMSQTLETKLNLGGASTFTQKVFCSDDRRSHYLSLIASVHANTDAPIGDLEVITVDFDTLRNYYIYIMSNKSTEGMTVDEVNKLSIFLDTIADYEYSPTTGELSTIHNLTFRDGAGNGHVVTLMFYFDLSGEIKAYIQVNKESPVNVFSLYAYTCYEKLMFSETTTAGEKQAAYDFYTRIGVSPAAKYAFDRVTASNSDGIISVYEPGMIKKTDKDGKVTIDYCLASDYRLFFNVEDNDIVGVAGHWVRYYDMSDSDTTQSGAYETITKLPYKFEATSVRFTYIGDGKAESIEGGTLGNGKFSVVITEDVVTVTDEKGNVTKYLRYAGTSVFNGFYSTLIYADYEGVCEIPDDQKNELVSSDANCGFTLTIDTKLSPDANGKCEQIVFKTYKYSERRSFITVNGKGEFFVLSSFMDKITNSSKQVFDNVLIDPTNRY